MTKKYFTVAALLSALSLFAFAQENTRDASSLDQVDPSRIGVESAEQRLKALKSVPSNRFRSKVLLKPSAFGLSEEVIRMF